MGTFKKIAWNTSRLVAQNGGAVSRALYHAANLYKKTYNNLNYDMETNGEFHVLDKLKKVGVKTIFDVGANKGDYTRACLSRFSDATIHAFEIAPPTYQKLKKNVSSERVVLNEFGLSNAAGAFDLDYNRDDDGSSSLLESSKLHGGNWAKISVNVRTGDSYCEEKGIGSIDLIKVDVEGVEHLVFDGFSKQFEREGISAVQFEFGMINIYSKFLLKDFYDLFSSHGFVLGPIMPRGVNFREYNTKDEDFQGPPNFFAVHRSKPEIIEAVRL
ncbi:FkbM family methyltransferase [Bosea sp. BH3]|uniref:FkbM family methyltransferase n=1 Tax=Bosea sp. BH3 TaxID=2871701 RepID=UPI0021CB3058|nr:FkbM family methyltransferase [Bosea sp. BH3]MCU4179037.1 FkbM family methyltransferase [Bosea sp. BH3]